MTFTRTITVVDHEVAVRTVEAPGETRAKEFTAITGGRRTAAFTAAAGLLVVALGLTPVVMSFIH